MSVLEDLGRETNGFFSYAGGAAMLLGESAGFIARLRIRVQETINQAYLLGVQSWAIVFLTSLCTGMVFSLESANQAVQYGVGNLVGGAVAFTMARELGSMVVTEQIEALQSLGLSPVRMLVVPRLIALMVMLPLLTVIADIVGIVGGMYIAGVFAHVSNESFINSARASLPFIDVLKGLLKSLVFAVIIAVIGSYSGLQTRGGAAGVGKSTTGAVVTAIILIFVFNFALSYILFPQ
jgi:phospholipid/cholesterol/gamma-HCH transport system permease protein